MNRKWGESDFGGWGVGLKTKGPVKTGVVVRARQGETLGPEINGKVEIGPMFQHRQTQGDVKKPGTLFAPELTSRGGGNVCLRGVSGKLNNRNKRGGTD